MKYLKWFIASMFIITTGCKSSHITSSWKAKNTENKTYTKILVLGLINDKDRSIRENMEEHMAGDLKNLGYSAVTSLDEYGPKSFDNLTEKEAIIKLQNHQIDAVVTIVMLNKKTEKEFIPAAEYRLRNSTYNNHHFWNYYDGIQKRILEPGYYVDNTEYFWESNLYEIKNQSLLYSVQTTSFNPDNSSRLGHEYGLIIVKDMTKKSILKKQAEEATLKAF